jgi:hypothetical protein
LNIFLKSSLNELVIPGNKNQHEGWYSIVEKVPAGLIFIGKKDSFYEISEGKCE